MKYAPGTRVLLKSGDHYALEPTKSIHGLDGQIVIVDEICERPNFQDNKTPAHKVAYDICEIGESGSVSSITTWWAYEVDLHPLGICGSCDGDIAGDDYLCDECRAEQWKM